MSWLNTRLERLLNSLAIAIVLGFLPLFMLFRGSSDHQNTDSKFLRWRLFL
jgi:hypothetical protein